MTDRLGLFARAMLESLSAHAASAVRDSVVVDALRDGGLDVIPERGPRVLAFVDGPLFHAMQRWLGDAAAEAIHAELRPMAAMLDDEDVSSIRPTFRPPALQPVTPVVPAPNRLEPLTEEQELKPLSAPTPRPSLTACIRPPSPIPKPRQSAVPSITPSPSRDTVPPPKSSGRRRRPIPMVPGLEQAHLMVATRNPETVKFLANELRGFATVDQVVDVVAVLEGVSPHANAVVLDCKAPSLTPATFIAIAPELPVETRVFLWGDSREIEAQLALVGQGLPPHWVCCGAHAHIAEIAALCRVLMPNSDAATIQPAPALPRVQACPSLVEPNTPQESSEEREFRDRMTLPVPRLSKSQS